MTIQGPAGGLPSPNNRNISKEGNPSPDMEESIRMIKQGLDLKNKSSTEIKFLQDSYINLIRKAIETKDKKSLIKLLDLSPRVPGSKLSESGQDKLLLEVNGVKEKFESPKTTPQSAKTPPPEIRKKTKHSLNIGTLEYDDGSYYNGTFRNNKPEGKGEFIGTESEYNGNWVNGKREGYGEEKFYNTLIPMMYQGNHVKGLRHGKGALLTVGSTYECEWRNGYPVDKTIKAHFKTVTGL